RGERLVVQRAAVAEGPAGEFQYAQSRRLLEVAVERLPALLVRAELALAAVGGHQVEHGVDVAQAHRLEGEGKRRGAAGGKGQERVDVGPEIVAAALPLLVLEVKDAAVAA